MKKLEESEIITLINAFDNLAKTKEHFGFNHPSVANVEKLASQFDLWLQDVRTKLKDGFRLKQKNIAIESFKIPELRTSSLNYKAMPIIEIERREAEKQLEEFLKSGKNSNRGSKRRKTFANDNEDMIISSHVKINSGETIEINKQTNNNDVEMVDFEVSHNENNIYENNKNNNYENKNFKIQKNFDEEKDIIEEMPSKDEDNLKMSISEEKSVKKNLIGFLYSEYSEIKLKNSHSDGKGEIGAEIRTTNEFKDLNVFNEVQEQENCNRSSMYFNQIIESLNIDNEIQKFNEEPIKNLESKARPSININNNFNNFSNDTFNNINEISSQVVYSNPILTKFANDLINTPIGSETKNEAEVLNRKDDKDTIPEFPNVPHKIDKNFDFPLIPTKTIINPDNITSKSKFPLKANVLKDKEYCMKILYENNESSYFDESPIVEKWSPVDDPATKTDNNQVASIFNCNIEKVPNLNISKKKEIEKMNFLYSTKFSLDNVYNNHEQVEICKNKQMEKFMTPIHNEVKQYKEEKEEDLNLPNMNIFSQENIFDNHKQVETCKNKLMEKLMTPVPIANEIKQYNNYNNVNEIMFTFQKPQIKVTEEEIGYEISDDSGSSSDGEGDEDGDVYSKSKFPNFMMKKKKQIPAWANDRAYLNSRVVNQKEINYREIFGKCKIDNLDLNIIFSGEKVYDTLRGDSADWRLDNTISTAGKNSDSKNNTKRKIDFNKMIN